MRRYLLIVLALLLSVSGLIAQERVSLSSPVTTPNGTKWAVSVVHKERFPPRIVVEAVLLDASDNVLQTVRDEHTQASAVTAASLLTTLNTLNNSVTSEEKRILLHLQGEGKIGAGSVTGSPQ